MKEKYEMKYKNEQFKQKCDTQENKQVMNKQDMVTTNYFKQEKD